jgi:DNA-binding MarR family transcriptional regulator
MLGVDRLTNLLGAQALAVSDLLLGAERGSRETVSERAALVTLLAHPDRPVSWLGAVLGLTSSGVTRLVDRLVVAGWVSRTPGADARSRRLALTVEGRDRAEAVLRARRAALSEVLAPLSAPDRAELERLLQMLVGSLADARPRALQVCRLCDRTACASGAAECPLEHAVAAEQSPSRPSHA